MPTLNFGLCPGWHQSVADELEKKSEIYTYTCTCIFPIFFSISIHANNKTRLKC